jgi:hypothetical protein
MKQEEHEARWLEILGEPWTEVHVFLDQFYLKYRSYTHRAILHHEVGIAHVRQRFGQAVRAAAEQHVLDDLGFDYIPRTPFDYFADQNFQPNTLDCAMLKKDCSRRLRLHIPFSVVYSLPAMYQGYPTIDLLSMWCCFGRGAAVEPPAEKIMAMNSLLREFQIAPVFQEVAKFRG